jgi:hypothetical protein
MEIMCLFFLDLFLNTCKNMFTQIIKVQRNMMNHAVAKFWLMQTKKTKIDN